MKDNSTEEVQKKISATRYPNISKANNTKVIVIGSLAAILLIFILSILFPSDNNGTETTEASTEAATTEAATEKQIDTGWQAIGGSINILVPSGRNYTTRRLWSFNGENIQGEMCKS